MTDIHEASIFRAKLVPVKQFYSYSHPHPFTRFSIDSSIQSVHVHVRDLSMCIAEPSLIIPTYSITCQPSSIDSNIILFRFLCLALSHPIPSHPIPLHNFTLHPIHSDCHFFVVAYISYAFIPVFLCSLDYTAAQPVHSIPFQSSPFYYIALYSTASMCPSFMSPACGSASFQSAHPFDIV